MSQQITIEDIYALFRASQEDLQRSKEEYDRRAAEAAAKSAEYDRRAAEAAIGMQKLERSVAETTRAVNALTTRWGRFVEELVEPAAVRLFRDRGIEVRETHQRIKNTDKALAMEIDILAVNGSEVVVIECKSRLSRDDVNDLLSKLPRFKQSFPRYSDCHVYGAVGGIEIDEGVDRYAYQRGLFVIKPSGDTVEIANDQKFSAATW